MSPHIERQIERVLILAGKPVMRRPIAAATVLDALPNACEADRAVCEQVRRYLRQYMSGWGVTTLEAQGAAAFGDSDPILPNAHGESADSPWRVEAHGFWQPSDYFIANVGGIAYEDNATATGSFLSAGFDWAQLDVGFRDHWLSPLSDSSSVISTEAPTMPSVTLSNYDPIGPFGLNYEVFWAEMSEQRDIPFNDSVTTGKPRIAGVQIGFEPTIGYAISANRIAQYGGGARNRGVWSQFIDELFQKDNLTFGQILGSNRVASLTSSILFPGRVPFSVDIEYAGEDNAYAEGYRLGATNLSLGLDFPRIGERFDATIEISEWQNDWYVHGIYPKGLTNHDRVLGHWFGDQRIFNDAIGGDSQMVSVGWHLKSGQYVRAIGRTMTLDEAWARDDVPRPYVRAYSMGLSFSMQWADFPLQFEALGGRDVFGESFTRVSASLDFVRRSSGGSSSGYESRAGRSDGVDLFVDAGASRIETTKILRVGEPPEPTVTTTGMHIGLGARRAVSNRNDIGVRIEFDEIDNNRMISLRAVDYRFRVTPWLALSGFLGAARFDYGLATNGYYWGGGLQLQDVVPKWDVAIDYRHYEKLNRDKTLPFDPAPTPETHPRVYIDADGFALYVSRRW